MLKFHSMFQHGRIESAKTIAILASPIRQEVIDTIEAMGGSATIREVAEQLGRPADGLYYHVEILRRGGLLVASNGRSKAGRGERRYRIPVASGDELGLVYRPGDRRNAAAVRGVVRGMLRIARRDFDAALARPDVVAAGDRRELWAARSTGWVSEADLPEINRLLARLTKRVRRPRGAGRKKLISICYVLAPLPVRPRRRAARRRP
jgi:hypothetical protein